MEYELIILQNSNTFQFEGKPTDFPFNPVKEIEPGKCEGDAIMISGKPSAIRIKTQEPIKMEQVIGKLYKYGKNMIVMCTGPGVDNSPKRMSGVVIQQSDHTSDFYVGSYSNSWTFTPDVCQYFEGSITINTHNFKPHEPMGACQG